MPEPAGVVAQAAARLRDAAARRVPCAPVRDIAGTSDVQLAYQIQAANIGRELAAGRRQVGRKIGLTSPAVQQQLGVNQPDFGTLLDSMAVRPGGDADMGRLLQPRVEGEIAFWLGADLDGELGGVEDIRLGRRGRGRGHRDCRQPDHRLGHHDRGHRGRQRVERAVRDLGRHRAADRVRATPGDHEPDRERPGCLRRHRLSLPGRSAGRGAVAGQGGGGCRRTATGCGEIVLSGALGPMVPVAAGDQVSVEISALGAVAVRFTGEGGADG